MKNFAFAGIVFGIILTVLLSPLFIVWSLNTLFPALSIPYNFWTWLAAIVLFGIVKAPNIKK